jgi:hypothetical protein
MNRLPRLGKPKLSLASAANTGPETSLTIREN